MAAWHGPAEEGVQTLASAMAGAATLRCHSLQFRHEPDSPETPCQPGPVTEVIAPESNQERLSGAGRVERPGPVEARGQGHLRHLSGGRCPPGRLLPGTL